MKRYIKKLISGMLALSMFTSTLITSSAATDVNVSVNVNPKIDIMLTSKDTTLNLDNFEVDVKTSLQNKGININNIQFQTVERNYIESEDADFANIVNTWDKEGAPVWSAKNNTIVCTITGGQPSWSSGSPPYTAVTDYRKNWKDMNMSYTSWWTAGLINPTAYDTEKLNATFTFERNGNLRNGFMFNVTKNANGTYNGYMFDITNHVGYWPSKTSTIGSWVYNHGDNNGYGTYRLALWRFENIDLDKSFSCSSGFWCWPHTTTQYTVGGVTTTNTPNERYTTLATWTMPRTPNANSTYNVLYDKNNIKITLDGTVVANVTDSTYKSGSYGFWTNNCERVDSMVISKFTVTSDKTKTYKDVLTEPTWRDNAKHIVVNVDDTIDDTLTSSATIGEILSRTLADDIHFVQWGTNTNKSASETFISRNDNKGLFVDNSNYNNAVEKTAEYITSLVKQESSEQYITIGQDISFSVDPAEYKTNATSTEYPNGRWKINHEYKYFANNQGQSSESGIPTSDLNFNFDKPGKYNILFDDKLVKEVYVHRKPVADFAIKISEDNTLLLNSLSYDLDSNEDKGYGTGISNENWYYKEASASEWIEGKLTEFDKTKIYVIKLEVEDYQGASAYTTKYTGTGNPVSNFNYANDVVSKYKPLIVNNSSYDPEGYEIVEQEWVLKRNDVLISTTNEPITDFNQNGLGEGKYTYTLVVKNSQGTVSEAFTKSFTIEEDYGKPEVAIGQQGCDWKHSQAVSLEFSDNESEFKNWRYVFSTSPVAPEDGWSDWSEETDTTIQLADVSGKYYLHIQAYDVASNELTRAVGTYNLDNTDPIINDVKTQKDEINKTFIKVEATDEHSGIVGYAITKAEPMTFNLRTRNTNLEVPTEFQESNILEVTDNGTYNVWTKDAAGNITSTVYTIEDVNYIGKNTTVYAEVGCEFKVTIPKHIILSGTTKTGAYTVSVEGDIAGTDKIKVVPDESFALSSTNLNDVTATIEQDKTEWSYDQILNNEFKIIGNGSIDAKDISAGSWNGNFNFNIALEGDKVYKNSEPFVEYIDILYDYEVEETE